MTFYCQIKLIDALLSAEKHAHLSTPVNCYRKYIGMTIIDSFTSTPHNSFFTLIDFLLGLDRYHSALCVKISSKSNYVKSIENGVSHHKMRMYLDFFWLS